MAAKKEIEKYINTPTLRPVLTPNYPVGCKRLLISNDYYPALARDNVEVITSPISQITTAAIETNDGRSIDVDTIIYATGFDTTKFLSPINITGAQGRKLDDVWANGAEAYLGVMVSGFPNMFMLYGPNTNLGHNSIIFMIECQVRHVINCISHLRNQGLGAIDVKEEAMRTFNDELQKSLGKSVWDAGCNSWYKNASGKIVNNWSSYTVDYWRRTQRLKHSDYHRIQKS